MPHLSTSCRPPAARQAGFSLVELLVVLAIMALLAGVLGSVLMAGYRAWDACVRATREATRTAPLAEQLQSDLQNAIHLGDDGVQGDAQILTLVVAGGGSHTATQPLRVRYIVELESASFLRLAAPVWAGDELERRVLLSGVHHAIWHYADVADPALWQPSWIERTNQPVRVHLTLLDQGGRPVFDRPFALRASPGHGEASAP